jgi:D-alanyl-D-alanine carboxypeptidase/D-alanyl-D-alanine-endopeptidase (penicillin-binding protein 4)
LGSSAREENDLNRRLRPLFTASLVFFALVGQPASTQPQEQPSLAQRLDVEVGKALRESTAFGLHVVDIDTGETVYAYQPDVPRVLASNTKLFTTSAALDALGPGFFFETRLLSRGEVRGDTLAGDLGVIGGGDPHLSGRDYGGDSFAVFRPWARQLRARGIRRVSGDLYLDHGLFSGPLIHPAWPPEQLASWYEAPIDALSFSDNCVLVRVSPGASGGLAKVELVPDVPILRIENTARTYAKRARQRVVVVRSGDVLRVTGGTFTGAGPLEVWVTVPDPVAYFGESLRAAFAEEGVEVVGSVRPVSHLPGPVWERVATHRTDLLTALNVTNKRSQNFYAESLLKLLGVRLCGEGSWERGVKAVSEFLVGIGIPRGSFQMTDGSGLARGNQFAPRHVTTLLRHMFFHRYGMEFVESLALSGGVEGSMSKRMRLPPYRGNVYAKTGTLSGVSALSGYARALSGRTYAFSIVQNQSRDVSASRAAQDRIVMALIDRG